MKLTLDQLKFLRQNGYKESYLELDKKFGDVNQYPDGGVNNNDAIPTQQISNNTDAIPTQQVPALKSLDELQYVQHLQDISDQNREQDRQNIANRYYRGNTYGQSLTNEELEKQYAYQQAIPVEQDRYNFSQHPYIESAKLALDAASVLPIGYGLLGKAGNVINKLESVNKFKSEIDWLKWNKEIPENTNLLKEYNDIEKNSKITGNWMKNFDGSEFKGTPEQFVQQNSENFKKAFPNAVRDKYGNIQYNYHGTPNELEDNMFKEHFSEGKLYGDGFYTTPNKDYALGYAQKRGNNSPNQKVYELYQNANKKQELTSVVEKSDERFKNFLKENPKGSEDFGKKFDVFMKQEDDLFEKYYDPNDFKLKQGFDYFKPNDLEQVVPYSNYPKSAVGNNGMFDMTNPNIYKAMIPIGLGSGYGVSQLNNNNGKKNN